LGAYSPSFFWNCPFCMESYWEHGANKFQLTLNLTYIILQS